MKKPNNLEQLCAEVNSDQSKIEHALTLITERENSVIKMYYGLNSDYTPLSLKDIGDLFDLSSARIGQIKEKGLRRLRNFTSEVFLNKEAMKIELEKTEKLILFDDNDSTTIYMRELLNKKLEDFDLSIRALNCVKGADIYTVGDLVKFVKSDLIKLRNMGRKSVIELEDFVANQGLIFGMDLRKYNLLNKLEIKKDETLYPEHPVDSWTLEALIKKNQKIKINENNSNEANEARAIINEVMKHGKIKNLSLNVAQPVKQQQTQQGFIDSIIKDDEVIICFRQTIKSIYDMPDMPISRKEARIKEARIKNHANHILSDAIIDIFGYAQEKPEDSKKRFIGMDVDSFIKMEYGEQIAEYEITGVVKKKFVPVIERVIECINKKLVGKTMSKIFIPTEELVINRNWINDLIFASLYNEDQNLLKLFKTSIRDVGFSQRVTNSLLMADIDTIGQLVAIKNPRNFYLFRNFGKKSFEEMKSILTKNGLTFGMDVVQYGYKKTILTSRGQIQEESFVQ